MIPIPLWLTPQVIKGGIIGAIVLFIFFAGFFFKGKLDAAKIQRMKAKVATTESNYDLCMEDVDRSEENFAGLVEQIETANIEIEKLNNEYNLRVVQLRELNRAAISQLNALHDASIRDMISEANDLRERFAQMSASEACHEAFVEIVK